MGRYSERYWDNQPNGLEEVVGTLFTAGLLNLVDDPKLAHQCEITDHETGVVGTTYEWWSSEEKAHAAASEDLRKKQSEFYADQRERERIRLKEYIPKTRIEGDETGLITLLVKWAVYVLLFCGALWLAFAVALPLVVINIASISLIIGLAIDKNKKYLFFLSFLGAIFILIDYNKGWFTKTLVTNVSFFEKAIPFFLYLNIAAGLIASYFLIRDFVNERNQPAGEEGEFSKRNLIIMGSIIAVGTATFALQKHFDSKRSTVFNGYANAQTQTVPNNVGTNGNTSSNQADSSVGKVDASTQKASASSTNNNYVNGTFSGAWFKVTVPPDFTARPSMKSNSGSGYESAFFDSPDSDVEFYIFSPQWGGEPTDIGVDQNTEKTTSTYSQKSRGKITTWSEIQALDGSYFRAYQDTKTVDGSVHWIIGLKYKSKMAYDKYKPAYLSFKKSLTQFSD